MIGTLSEERIWILCKSLRFQSKPLATVELYRVGLR
jgi:hypothetical protein